MYNGIGLNTPRGSGTNGYVVRNMSFVRPPRTDKMQDFSDLKAEKPTIRAPNRDILLHDRKRKVEVKCMELRVQLEDEDLSTDEIENKVQELRESLMSNFDEVQPRDAKSLQDHETHQRNAAKEEENKKMMRALRIDSSSYVEGAAFDPEVQEKRRQERIARHQAAEESRLRNMEKRRRRDRSPSPYRSRRDDGSRGKRRRTRGRSPTPSSSGSDSEDDQDRRSRRRNSRRSRSYSRSASVDSRDRRRHRSRRRSPTPSVSRSPSRSVSRSPSRSPRRSRRRSPSYSRSESEDERDRKYSSRRHHRSPSSDSRSPSVESDGRRNRRDRFRSISRSVSRSASSDSRSSRD
ncbi:cwf21 domain-containing protein [Fennellomyces sp. T-0311]|nr:cwf21 domain-containing protein [Fennellomyces sp. T-0311]